MPDEALVGELVSSPTKPLGENNGKPIRTETAGTAKPVEPTIINSDFYEGAPASKTTVAPAIEPARPQMPTFEYPDDRQPTTAEMLGQKIGTLARNLVRNVTRHQPAPPDRK